MENRIYLFQEFCEDCTLKAFCKSPCEDVVQYYKDNTKTK